MAQPRNARPRFQRPVWTFARRQSAKAAPLGVRFSCDFNRKSAGRILQRRLIFFAAVGVAQRLYRSSRVGYEPSRKIKHWGNIQTQKGRHVTPEHDAAVEHRMPLDFASLAFVYVGNQPFVLGLVDPDAVAGEHVLLFQVAVSGPISPGTGMRWPSVQL